MKSVHKKTHLPVTQSKTETGRSTNIGEVNNLVYEVQSQETTIIENQSARFPNYHWKGVFTRNMYDNKSVFVDIFRIWLAIA